MMIEVTKGGPELEALGPERCCFCRAQTSYWYAPKDVACCPRCAEVTGEDDVPSKSEWVAMEKERAREAEFESELKELINRHSQENRSGTPDFILAEYLSTCLAAYNAAVSKRELWHGQPKRKK